LLTPGPQQCMIVGWPRPGFQPRSLARARLSIIPRPQGDHMLRPGQELRFWRPGYEIMLSSQQESPWGRGCRRLWSLASCPDRPREGWKGHSRGWRCHMAWRRARVIAFHPRSFPKRVCEKPRLPVTLSLSERSREGKIPATGGQASRSLPRAKPALSLPVLSGVEGPNGSRGSE